MRLMLVISSLTAGGAERVMSTLANAWSRRGEQIHLVTTHAAGRPPHYPLDPAITLHNLTTGGNRWQRQWRVVRSVAHLVARHQPDVVISFLNYTNVLTLLATRGRVPTVISERLDPRVISMPLSWRLLRRLTYRRAAALVAQTATAAELYRPLTPAGVTVIPNPLVVPDPPAPGTVPDLARPTVIAIGRLHWQKGFDIALQAFARLPERYRDWQLVILGEGSLRPDLLQLRDALGLTERVRLVGQVPDPFPWLTAADIFLLSSRSEGFPNVLCEAMAMTLPVVAADCPSGPREILADGEYGLIVPPEDPAETAAALQRLMDDSDLRKALGQRAREAVKAYALPLVLQQWDTLIERVTGRPFAAVHNSRGERP